MPRGRPRKNPLPAAPEGPAPSLPDAVIPASDTQTMSSSFFNPVAGNATPVDLQSQFEAELAKLEAPTPAKSSKEDREAQPAKNEPESETEDPLEKEIEEAAAAAKLEVSKEDKSEKSEEKTEEKADDDKQESDDPDAPAGEGDDYQKWLNTLSKPAKSRIERQQRQIAKLTAAAADRITVAPTAKSPLSHVTTQDQLDAERADWEAVRNEARRLAREMDADPDTELKIKTPGGRVYKFADAEEMANAEAYAVAVLDAVPEAKIRLIERANVKPWETAKKLVSDIFEKDSDAYKRATEFLSQVPEITMIPDYEVKIAHMLRSIQMEAEEKAGKAKWVRLELDDKGRAKLPKKAAPPKQEGRAPSTPTANRPALSANGSSDSLRQKVQALEKSGSDDDLRAAVAEMLKGAA